MNRKAFTLVVSKPALRARLREWSIERALTTPRNNHCVALKWGVHATRE